MLLFNTLLLEYLRQLKFIHTLSFIINKAGFMFIRFLSLVAKCGGNIRILNELYFHFVQFVIS